MACKTYTVDRIEGNVAVCEDESGKMVNIPISVIKGDVADGAMLTSVGDSYIAVKSKNASNRELFDKLFKKGH